MSPYPSCIDDVQVSAVQGYSRGRMIFGNSQFENFGCISGLYTVPLALPSITRDYAEVCSSNGEDRPSVLGVWVKGLLNWLCH